MAVGGESYSIEGLGCETIGRPKEDPCARAEEHFATRCVADAPHCTHTGCEVVLAVCRHVFVASFLAFALTDSNLGLNLSGSRQPNSPHQNDFIRVLHPSQTKRYEQ
jgi:hypothetical protein